MVLTLIGLVTFFAGIVIFFSRSLTAALSFFLICTLFAGSAAFILPGLGSSSVQPAYVALAFLLARVLLPSGQGPKPVAEAIRENMWLGIFAVYAVISAYAMPRIFAGQMDVVPMRPADVKNLFDAFPLRPSNQNVTAAVYIVGSFLIAVCTGVAVRQSLGAVRFVRVAVVIVWIHALFGASGALFGHTVWGAILSIFRNGSYAQVEQSLLGYQRIAGIMPEASTYAAFGFGWFVLLAEFWLRDIQRARTGRAALVMLVVLVASTSSTAYASLLAYMMIIAVRMLLFPNAFKFRKLAWIVGIMFMGALATGMLLLLNPEQAKEFSLVFQHTLLDKASSGSGLQRMFWAQQGLEAFKLSFGLGIGAGSFRSSSLLTAIIGSMGIVGVISFVAYVVVMFKPMVTNTFMRCVDPVDAVGVSASWAALCILIPAGVSAPSPDPGPSFCIFAAVALALRSIPRQRLLTHMAALELAFDREGRSLQIDKPLLR